MSLTALILSIIVIGGIVGIVGFVLSAIGLRRAKSIGRGRAMALGGMALAGLSVLFSTLAVGFLVAALNGGEEKVINDIATRSSNTEFPPQLDLDEVVCESSGDLALATVSITNNSRGESIYGITVEWETDLGTIVSGTVQSELLPADGQQSLRLFDQTGNGVPDTCRVSRIERSGLGFLPG